MPIKYIYKNLKKKITPTHKNNNSNDNDKFINKEDNYYKNNYNENELEEISTVTSLSTSIYGATQNLLEEGVDDDDDDQTTTEESIKSNKTVKESGELFKEVFFRNEIIRKTITYYLRLFNIHYHQREFTIYQLKNYKYKEYLRSILIKLDNTISPILLDDREGQLTSQHLNLLPPNIKYLEFPSKFNSPIPNDVLSYYPSITSVKFGKHFNCQLPTSELLPAKLKKLQFSSNGYHKFIPVNNFSKPSITQLSMGDNGNHKIQSGSIPISVRHLTIGNDYNHKLKPGQLPPLLLSLEMGGHFNSIILENSLPQTLTSLTLNNEFNQEIKLNQLPQSLTYLELSFSFNHSFTCTATTSGSEKKSKVSWLPNGLKTLILNYNYNKKIEIGSLPDSITHLNMGFSYNHTIEKGSLPNNLKKLILSSNFSKKLSVGVLPQQLEYLDMGQQYNEPIVLGFFPQSLTYLKFSNTWNQSIEVGVLPQNLKTLEFGQLFTKSFISSDVLPKSLTRLSISHTTNFDQVNLFPKSLTCLNLLPLRRNIEIGEIPTSIKHLKFDNISFDLNPGSIPNWIETLEFGTYFNRSINETWFSVGSILNSIKFGYFFNQPILPHAIPSTVKHFEIGLRFNQDLTSVDGILPQSLTSLALNDSHPLKFDLSKLPSTLTSLSCYNTNQLLLNQLDIDKYYSILKVILKPSQ